MNILLSILCFVMGIYLAFFQESKCNHETEFKGGLWVTRDVKGQVLSTSVDGPLFINPYIGYEPIRGIVSYGYEWKIKEKK